MGYKNEVKVLQHELLFKVTKYIRNLMKENLLLVTYTGTKSSASYAQKWGRKMENAITTNIILIICNCYMAVTDYQNNTEQFHHTKDGTRITASGGCAVDNTSLCGLYVLELRLIECAM